MCEKFKNKECVGGFWCGICPLYEYENGCQCIPTYSEEFAMKAQRKIFQEYNKCIKLGKREQAMAYYSCIQFLEYLLKGVIE